MDLLPHADPWQHAHDCAVLLDWKLSEHARELEDDERRAERRRERTERERP